MMFGPLVVVGPQASVDQVDLRGCLLVPVDGSDNAETVLGLAAAWGIGLEARPWIVAVIPPERRSDLLDSTYPASVARRLARRSHHPVDFEVLHDEHPGRAIGRFAGDIGASLIVASTHGRAGLARFAIGSRAMSIVRHAPCPVVLSRPPHLRRVSERALMAAPLKPAPTTPPIWRTPAPAFSAPLERSSSMVVATVADLASRSGVDPASIEVADARAGDVARQQSRLSAAGDDVRAASGGGRPRRAHPPGTPLRVPRRQPAQAVRPPASTRRRLTAAATDRKREAAPLTWR